MNKWIHIANMNTCFLIQLHNKHLKINVKSRNTHNAVVSGPNTPISARKTPNTARKTGLNGFRKLFYFFECPNSQIFEHVLYQNDVCHLYFLTIFFSFFISNFFENFKSGRNFSKFTAGLCYRLLLVSVKIGGNRRLPIGKENTEHNTSN